MRSPSAEMSLKSYAKLITAGIGKYYSPLAKLLSTGNAKLPRTTAIFNMGSAHDCPSFKLGLCRAFDKNGKHVCYARKSETSMRPDVEPYRNRQKAFWLACTAEEFASQFLLINAMKELPWDSLRFSEAGDFWGQDCVVKLERIATILAPYGIKTYCYTCRSDLDYTQVRNLVVSGTSFQKAGITNVFMMVEDVKTDRPKGYGVCPMDCKGCNRCYTRGFKTVVPRH